MLRELSREETGHVSGGEIVVWGPRFDPFTKSISGEEWAAMMLSSPILYGDFEVVDASIFGDIKEWLNENLDWLAEQFGYDLINEDHQKVINADLNTKTVKDVGTEHLPDGEKWNFVDTTDGVRYYDRNGDGDADLKVRQTEHGWQTDTGDGAGWSMAGA